MMKAEDMDRLKRNLYSIIDSRVVRTDYHALYPMKVVAQNDDGTLELQSETPAKVPGCSKVRMRLGLPGCAVKVAAGASVLLGFQGGDPTKPYATLWGASVLTELAIGEAPTKHLALAEDVKAALDAIVTAFSGHTHTVALGACTSGGATGATATTGAASISPNTNVASATVKST